MTASNMLRGLFPFLILLASLTFWLSRFELILTLNLFLLLICFSYIYFVYFNNILKEDYHKVSVLILFILITIVSALLSRYGGYDGRVNHLKIIAAIVDKGYYLPLYENTKPILTDIFLGFIARYTGMSVVNALFGLAFIFSGYSFYSFLRKSNFSRNKSLILVISFLFSPSVIVLSFYEFKVDIFILSVFMLILLNFVEFIKTIARRQIVVIAILSSILMMSKFTTVPIIAVISLLILYEILSKSNKKFLEISLYLFTLIVPLVIYILIYGIRVPGVNVNLFHPLNQEILPLNNLREYQCNSELIVVDHQRFMSKDSLLDSFFGPISLITKNKLGEYGTNVLNLFTPFVYVSIFLAFFVPIFLDLRSKKQDLYLYLIVFVYLIFFHLFIRVNYWYLIPIVPICMYFLGKILTKSNFPKIVVNSIYLFILIESFLLLFLAGISLYKSSYRVQNSIHHDLVQSNYLESIPDKGIILDTSFVQYAATYPYFAESDKYIVKDRFIFANDQSELSDIHLILKENGIKYLLRMEPTPPYLTDGRCLGFYNERLNKYLEEFTEIDYSNGKFKLYKLK